MEQAQPPAMDISYSLGIRGLDKGYDGGGDVALLLCPLGSLRQIIRLPMITPKSYLSSAFSSWALVILDRPGTRRFLASL